MLLKEEFPEFVNSLSEPAPVSIRMNTGKQTTPEYPGTELSWCKDGFYLDERPSFTLDPLFQAGCYYVQEASSMFLEQIFTQVYQDGKPLVALDLCAAPGGKSTHLLSLLPSGSLLVCNEVVPLRNKILQQNIVKWGNPNVLITQNQPEDFESFPEYFDLVLVDAPCSGEGLFRREPDAAKEWSPDQVQRCAIRQSKILKNAIASLKPGGIVIYSTCTFDPAENEDQVRKLTSDQFKQISIKNIPAGIIQNEYGMRFYPHRIKGEGLFYSVIQKINNKDQSDEPGTNHSRQSKKKVPNFNITEKYKNEYLTDPGKFIEIKIQNHFHAIPETSYRAFEDLNQKLYIRHSGVYLGEEKGKDFVPSHDLALSKNINKRIPSVELNLEEAIRFIRCETINPNASQKGWHIVKYKSVNLGWIKVLQERVNNYFPKEWRVLKEAINQPSN